MLNIVVPHCVLWLLPATYLWSIYCLILRIYRAYGSPMRHLPADGAHAVQRRLLRVLCLCVLRLGGSHNQKHPSKQSAGVASGRAEKDSAQGFWRSYWPQVFPGDYSHRLGMEDGHGSHWKRRHLTSWLSVGTGVELWILGTVTKYHLGPSQQIFPAGQTLVDSRKIYPTKQLFKNTNPHAQKQTTGNQESILHFADCAENGFLNCI